MLLAPIVYLVYVLSSVLMAFYAERKLSAFFQDRLGPMEVGKFGLLQAVADVLKLMQKRNSMVAGADRVLFWAAPVFVFLAVFAGFLAVPLWAGGSVGGGSAGIFVVLGLVALDVAAIWAAGWASNSKFSLLGAMRAINQMLSYEVPLGLSILAVVVFAGTLDLEIIGNLQASDLGQVWWLGRADGFDMAGAGGGLLSWNIVQAPWLIPAFVLYYISALAECNRAPFDLPEGESEIIGGFHTEYSGFGFALFFLAEYALMALVATVGSILFLGGWHSPLPNVGPVALYDFTSGTIAWQLFWIVIKVWLWLASMVWLRWTLPRLRMDQLMTLGWKVLTPIGLVLVLTSILVRAWAEGLL